MPSPKVKKFLNSIISYVKFPFDREDIKIELHNHILDRMDDYIEQGMDEETAEQLTLNDMGDAKEIGLALNKEHNPLIGWIWAITNAMVILFGLWVFFIAVFPILSGILPRNLVREIPKSDIEYKIDIDEKVRLDDRVIHFTDLVYEINGDMNLFYESYGTTLRELGWGIGTIGEISDNLGNTYIDGSGFNSGGIKTKSRRTIENFSNEADTLIITYDYFDRYYQVEVSLKEGEHNE
jgi:hypothetical protein